jgi:hypothetical protein
LKSPAPRRAKNYIVPSNDHSRSLDLLDSGKGSVRRIKLGDDSVPDIDRVLNGQTEVPQVAFISIVPAMRHRYRVGARRDGTPSTEQAVQEDADVLTFEVQPTADAVISGSDRRFIMALGPCIDPLIE